MTTGTRPPKPGPGYEWDEIAQVWIFTGIGEDVVQEEGQTGPPIEPGLDPNWWRGMAEATQNKSPEKQPEQIEIPPGMQYVGTNEFGAPEFMPLTERQVTSADFNQPVQIRPGEFGGPEVMPLTPPQPAQPPQPPRKQDILFNIMKDVFPDMTVSYGVSPEQAADVATSNLFDMLDNQPDQFITRIREKGWNPNTEALLLGVGFKWEQLKTIFPSTFEDEDVQNARTLALQSPKKFAEMIQTGDRAKSEDLLIRMGATREQIDTILPPQEIPYRERVVQIRTILQSPEGMSLQEYNAIERRFTGFENLITFETPTGEKRVRIEGKTLSGLDWWRRNVGEPVIEAVGKPLFTVAGIGVSAGDIVNLAALGFGIYQGVKSLIPIVQEIGDKTLQTALNLGLDKWIARMARGVPPEKFKDVQNALYNFIVKDRVWLQEQATNNWLARKGMTPNVPMAAQQAVDDTITAVENRFMSVIPRGTQTGAMAFGGKAVPPVPPPSGSIGKVPEPTPKEPWMMTQKEFNDIPRGRNASDYSVETGLETPTLQTKDLISHWTIRKWEEAGKPSGQAGKEYIAMLDKYGANKGERRIVIEQALSEGKPVPPEVLKDYPDLAAKAQPVVPEKVTPEVTRGLPENVRNITPEQVKTGDVIEFRGDKAIGSIGGKVLKANRVTLEIETDYMGKPMTITVKRSDLRGEGRALINPTTLPKAEAGVSETGMIDTNVLHAKWSEAVKNKSPEEATLSKQLDEAFTHNEQVRKAQGKTGIDKEVVFNPKKRGRPVKPSVSPEIPVTETTPPAVTEVVAGKPVAPPVKAEVVTEPSPKVDMTVSEVHTEIQKAIDYWRNKSQTADEVKLLLNKIANGAPAEVKGQMLTAMKDIKTEADLTTAIDKLGEVAERYTQKVLTAEIGKAFAKTTAKKEGDILKGKFTPEVQSELDVLRSGLKVDRAEAIAKIQENVAAMDAGTLDWDEGIRRNELLNYSGIKGMNSSELAGLLDYVKTIKTVGRIERLEKVAKAKAEMKTAVNDIVGGITGGKGVIPGRESLAKEAAAKKAGPVSLLAQRNLHTLFDLIARKAGKLYEDTALYKFATENVYRPKIAEATARSTDFEGFGTKAKEIFSTTKSREVDRIFRDMSSKKVNLGTFKNTDGKPITLEFTKAEIIQYHQWLQDPKLDRTFNEGMKWTPEIKDAINKSLTKQEKAWSDYQMATYKVFYDKVNPVYRERYGVNLPDNPRYSPKARDFQTKVPEVQSVYKDAMQFHSNLPSSIKATTDNILSLRPTDSTRAFMNHVNQIEFFIHQSGPVKNLRTLMANPDVKIAIEQGFGKATVREINTNIDRIANRGLDASHTVAWLDKLRSNSALAQLAYKPLQFLNQLPTMLIPLTEQNPLLFGKGIANFWKNAEANTHEMMTEHRYIIDRYTGGNIERDIKAAITSETFRPVSGKSSVRDVMFFTMQLGDKFGTLQSYWTMYQEGLTKFGKDAAGKLRAQEFAGQAMDRMQNTSSLDTLTSLQSGGSFWKALTMYASQPSKYFQIIDVNVRNLKYHRGNPLQAIQAIIMAAVILPMMFELTKSAFKFRKDKQLFATLLSPLNDLLIAGQVFQTIENWLTGDMFDYQASPVLSIPRDAINAWMKGMSLKGKVDDPAVKVTWDEVAEFAESVAKPAGAAFGLPTPYLTQVEKALRGTVDKTGQRNRDYRELVFSRFGLQEPTPDAAQKSQDTANKIGQMKPPTPSDAADKVPKTSNMGDYWSEQNENLGKILPSDITAKNGFDDKTVVFGKAKLAYAEMTSLPGKPLYKIVDDMLSDPTIKYTTVMQYYLDWQKRQELTSLADIVEFDRTHPRAELGNITPDQLDLLLKYEQATNKKQFLVDNPLVKITPDNEWLKKYPEQNALLAIHGQAKVLTQAAYNEAQRLIKELDIPDSAVGDFIPPKDVAKPYFDYQDAEDKFGASSAQAMLIRAKNYPGLDDFKSKTSPDLKPPENSVAYYDLKVKNYDKQKEYEALKETNDNITKDVDGFTALQKVQMQFKASNKEWADNSAMAEAHSKGTFEKPTPDETVKAHLDFDRLARDKKGVQPEEKLYYIDNPEYHKWALENKLTTADSEKWNEPVLRIQVKPEYQKIDKTIEDYKDTLPDIPNKNDPAYKTGRQYATEQLKATKDGIAYDEDVDRIEAYTRNGTEFVDDWVIHGQESRKFSGGSAEVKVWLFDNRKVWTWALGEKLLTDTGNDWNIPALRIDVQWRKQDTEYQAILDKYNSTQQKEQDAATKAYFDKTPGYKAARNRRDGYELGLTDQPILWSRPGEKTPIEQWVEYKDLPGSGYYYQERYLLANPNFLKAVNAAQKSKGQSEWSTPDPAKVPARQYDEITQQFKPQLDAYENMTGATPAEIRKKRADMLAADPNFAQARLTRDAYKLLIGLERYVPDYVAYYNKVNANVYGDNYEDDWYLMEHEDFYDTMLAKKGWQPKDFTKVPSRKVWAAYQVYRQPMLTTLDKNRMRAADLDLDTWLFNTKKVKEKIETVKDYEKLRAQGGPSLVAAYKRSKQQEEFEKKGAEFDRLLEDLKRKVGVR